jgi:hypothetical protein
MRGFIALRCNGVCPHARTGPNGMRLTQPPLQRMKRESHFGDIGFGSSRRRRPRLQNCGWDSESLREQAAATTADETRESFQVTSVLPNE